MFLGHILLFVWLYYSSIKNENNILAPSVSGIILVTIAHKQQKSTCDDEFTLTLWNSWTESSEVQNRWYQWSGGSRISLGGRGPLMWELSVKMYVKTKELGPMEGGMPPRSANAMTPKNGPWSNKNVEWNRLNFTLHCEENSEKKHCSIYFAYKQSIMWTKLQAKYRAYWCIGGFQEGKHTITLL